MVKKECEKKCGFLIDLNKDLYVLLGTYDGKKEVQKVYFHIKCWRDHFEEKTKEKAQVIVNNMQDRMMPIARQLTDKLKKAIGERDGGQVIKI